MIHRNSDLRFSRTPRVVRFFLIAVTLAALFAPMNFVFITPGPATSLFPKVLTIKSDSYPVNSYPVNSYPVNGQLFLLTIYVSNPETYIPGIQVLGCWAWADCVVLPRSVMYDDGATNEKEAQLSNEDMSQSQNIALVAAKGFISKRYPHINLAGVKDSSVSINLKNTGGPSGGLIFTLGLIDLLTPEDILQSREIAGTGTIEGDGSIGAIGGVTEKIIGAKKAGASILFVSRENCDQLPESVEGIHVVAISSIAEAVDYLLDPAIGSNSAGKEIDSAGIHGCASVGA